MVTSTVACIALLVAGLCWWQQQWLKVGVVAAFVAGVGLTTGVFGASTAKIASLADTAGEQLSAVVAGQAIGGLAALAAIIWVAVDLRSTPTRGTVLVALLIPALAVTIPGDLGVSVRELLSAVTA